MKKLTFIIIISIIVFAASVMPMPAHAVEASLGVTGMYDWWQPPFLKLHYGDATRLFGFRMNHDEDGSFMLGPDLKIWFGSWRMNLTALFGVTKNEFDYTSLNWDLTIWNIIDPPIIKNYIMLGDSSARRYDVDLKFAKSIHRFVNFNIGGRFNYAKGDGSQYRIYIPLDFNFGDDEYHLWQVGPVIGIGFNFEIKNFTIYFDINGIATIGNNYLERKLVFPRLFPYLMPFKYDTYFLGFGFDTDAGIAYYIAPAHLSIGAGFRWVGVVCASTDDDGSMLDLSYKKGWINSEWDHFYGITFNVSYKF